MPLKPVFTICGYVDLSSRGIGLVNLLSHIRIFVHIFDLVHICSAYPVRDSCSPKSSLGLPHKIFIVIYVLIKALNAETVCRII